MRIFDETDLSDMLEERENYLRNEVYAEDKNKLLNLNETEYIDYLVNKYQVEPLILDTDRKYISSSEQMISGARFPSFQLDVDERASYKKVLSTCQDTANARRRDRRRALFVFYAASAVPETSCQI